MLPDKTWTTTDGVIFEKILPIHICTRDDLPYFYPSNKNYASAIASMFSKMYCLDDLKQLTLWGNFNTDFNKIIYVQALKC